MPVSPQRNLMRRILIRGLGVRTMVRVPRMSVWWTGTARMTQRYLFLTSCTRPRQRFSYKSPESPKLAQQLEGSGNGSNVHTELFSLHCEFNLRPWRDKYHARLWRRRNGCNAGTLPLHRVRKLLNIPDQGRLSNITITDASFVHFQWIRSWSHAMVTNVRTTPTGTQRALPLDAIRLCLVATPHRLRREYAHVSRFSWNKWVFRQPIFGNCCCYYWGSI